MARSYVPANLISKERNAVLREIAASIEPLEENNEFRRIIALIEEKTGETIRDKDVLCRVMQHVEKIRILRGKAAVAVAGAWVRPHE